LLLAVVGDGACVPCFRRFEGQVAAVQVRAQAAEAAVAAQAAVTAAVAAAAAEGKVLGVRLKRLAAAAALDAKGPQVSIGRQERIR
jgi:hypothetical protein